MFVLGLVKFNFLFRPLFLFSKIYFLETITGEATALSISKHETALRHHRLLMYLYTWCGYCCCWCGLLLMRPLLLLLLLPWIVSEVTMFC